jgi:XTP/dITP diphosphohydrolase
MKEIIFGTKNPAKILQIQGVLLPIGIKVKGIAEYKINIQPPENFETPQENARSKALTYAKAIGEPVLSMDNALYFEGLDPKDQPGVHIRRIASRTDRPADQEVLNYWTQKIEILGGSIKGYFNFAICFGYPNGKMVETIIRSDRIFVSKVSKVVIPGYPLESIQIDPITNKYVSEMTQAQQDQYWRNTIGKELVEFISRLNI